MTLLITLAALWLLAGVALISYGIGRHHGATDPTPGSGQGTHGRGRRSGGDEA